MALGDLTRRVVTTYDAITDPQEKALERLKGKTVESGQSFTEWAKGLNENFNGIVEGLGKLDLAFEGLHKVVDIGKESIKAYGDELRLTAAAGAADIDKLSEAAAGLKSEHELLTFAAQTQHGVFKLNQEQMETTQKAIVALTRAGFDQETATDKVTNAVIGLKTKGLDKLGISVREGKDDAEKFSNIMEALAEKAGAASSSTSEAAEAGGRMSVEWQNSIEKLKVSIGSLIVSLEPLVNLISRAVGYIADGLNWEATTHGKGITFGAFNAVTFGYLNHELTNKLNNEVNESQSGTDSLLAGLGTDAWAQNNSAAGGFASDLLSGPGAFARSLTGEGPQLIEAKIGDWLTKRKKAADDAREKAKQLLEAQKKLSDEVAKTSTDELVAKLSLGGEDYTSPVQQLGGYSAVLNGGAGVPSDITSSMLLKAKVSQEAAGYGAFQSRQNASFLQGMFGKLEEFNAYKEAFSALSGAATSAYDAMVDGNKSAGQAVRDFVGDALKALGSRMLVRALEETAEGIASIALGPVGGASAAAHFAAAGAFAAAAGAAGIAASAVGTSASHSAASSGSSSSAAAAATTASSSTASGTGPIIVYGDSFSDDSPRMRQVKAEKMWKRAMGTSYARAG